MFADWAQEAHILVMLRYDYVHGNPRLNLNCESSFARLYNFWTNIRTFVRFTSVEISYMHTTKLWYKLQGGHWAYVGTNQDFDVQIGLDL